MNISSIVVQTVPEHLDAVVTSLKACEVCDYHMHDEKGRIIITIEGENVSKELEKLRVVEAIPYVYAADMQMAYSEDELDEQIDFINKREAVPKVLNDSDVDIDRVMYNGDMKKREDMVAFANDFDSAKLREQK